MAVTSSHNKTDDRRMNEYENSNIIIPVVLWCNDGGYIMCFVREQAFINHIYNVLIWLAFS